MMQAGELLAVLRDEERELLQRLATVRATIAATEASLAVPGDRRALVRTLVGLRQIDALRCIARVGGGQFRATDARDMLTDAGLMQGNPRNHLTHLYKLIEKSEDFTRIAPGVFALGATASA